MWYLLHVYIIQCSNQGTHPPWETHQTPEILSPARCRDQSSHHRHSKVQDCMRIAFYCLSRVYLPLSKHSPSLPFLYSPQSLSINAPPSTSVRSAITNVYVSENRQFLSFCAWLMWLDTMISVISISHQVILCHSFHGWIVFHWGYILNSFGIPHLFGKTCCLVKHAGVFDILISFHLDMHLIFVGHSGFHEIWYNAARNAICPPACWRGEVIGWDFWWGFLLPISAVLIIRFLFLLALQTNLK